MSKRAKQLLRENNELEEQIRDEAARAALTDMIVYIRSANISAYNQELVRRDIWQMIADGERRGESVEEIIGGDYKAFCDSVIAELPQLRRAAALAAEGHTAFCGGAACDLAGVRYTGAADKAGDAAVSDGHGGERPERAADTGCGVHAGGGGIETRFRAGRKAEKAGAGTAVCAHICAAAGVYMCECVYKIRTF